MLGLNAIHFLVVGRQGVVGTGNVVKTAVTLDPPAGAQGRLWFCRAQHSVLHRLNSTATPESRVAKVFKARGDNGGGGSGGGSGSSGGSGGSGVCGAE